MPYERRSLAERAAVTVCSILLLTGGTACGQRSTPRPDPDVPLPEPLYFEPIGRGQSADLADTTQVVFRDSLEWQAFQEKLDPRQPFVAVDFTQAMVLVAAIPAPSSGYGIEFESIGKLDGNITASYVLFRPGYDCMAAPAPTTPFQAVLVRRAEGEVHFEHRLEDLPCTFRQRR